LDLNDPDRPLHDISPGSGKHKHEIIDPTRRWFQLVAIDSVILIVHKGTARESEALPE
jgi:hypothetical protein